MLGLHAYGARREHLLLEHLQGGEHGPGDDQVLHLSEGDPSSCGSSR